MSFETYGSNTESSESTSTVDWAALNKYMIETCDLQEEEVITGVISSIVDLGLQEQEDAAMEFKGTEEDEAAELEKNPESYFENMIDYNDGGKEKRYKRWKQRDKQCVAVTVDFPDIIVDKGQFFGDSNPAPLRLLLGGEFFLNGKNIVARMVDLSIRKNDKTNNVWSFAPNHTFHKMAVGTKLINKSEPFLPNDIDKLLGKACQFKVQVFENKKGYYTERCSFASGLGRGMNAPELDESLLSLIQFNQDNDEKALKDLRASIINTMSMSSKWDESKVKVQLEKLGRLGGNSTQGKESQADENDKEEKPKPSSKSKKVEKVEVVNDGIDYEDDIPF